ncbi:hypothetical protein IWW56_000715 [Coemansia sp. RSA 2131]|nr:hypothetical protein IWW56_000715 [Coemansia sp. RSA 2131]
MDGDAGAQAEKLYTEAVHETPPNRNKLDRLVDVLCDHPRLLYDSFFAKAHEAAGIAVDIWHGTGDMMSDDNLLILTPPALWGWTVMEETVCHAPPQELRETRYPQLAQQFLNLAEQTLAHPDTTPGPVVRRTIQALTRFWPEIINACISLKTQSPAWRQMYEAMLQRADSLMQLSENSDDPALQMHLAKFLETEATIFTAVPQPGGSSRSTLSLDHLPDSHAYISKAALATRGERARQQLLRLLPSSDHIRLCNTSFITATINSIVYLMNLRPQFCEQLLERLINWYVVTNSSEQTMTHLQSVVIGKTLSIALLQLYTRRYMGAYSEVLERALDALNGPEWVRWQEQQARERERRQRQQARQRSQARRQVPDEDPHSTRWVPAPEDGQDELAYQPAPGADAELGTMASQPSSDAAGQKRTAHADDDDDEEKQMLLLEESAKRVKLGEEAKMKKKSAASAEERRQIAVDTDQEMEAEMQVALQSELPFELPSMDEMTSDARQEHVVEAIRRVISGSECVRKFIEHKRVLHSVDAASGPRLQTLANGLSTNSKVLEDSMVMLVRLVTNCYVMFFEASRTEASPAHMDASSQWNEMQECVEGVLQSIVDAPRAQYGLAMILLYELWMSVVVTDPELARTPEKSDSEYTVLALYLRWCERIFDAIVASSMEMACQQVERAAAETADGAAVVPQQQPELDELLLEFIKDVPYLPLALLSKVEACLKSPSTAALGFVTLERAIEQRPPIFSAGLDILLTYSAHPDRATRVGCIRAVKKHYPNGASAQRISKMAGSSFKMGVERATKQSAEMEQKVAAILNQVDDVSMSDDVPMSDEAVEMRKTEAAEKKKADAFAMRKQGEQVIEAGLVVHMELLLALSTKNMDLLTIVFDAYKDAPLTVQISIRRIITPLVKSMVNTPAKITPVLTQFPVGAETLAQRMIFLLCADATRVPARELVQGVLGMCDKRNLDGNFMVFLVNGMDREEALKRLPSIVGILDGSDGPRMLVRESFARLTTSSLNRPSVLSPTQLLMGLHDEAVVSTGQKAVEAVGVYEAMAKPDGTRVFSTPVFDTALKLLAEQEHVSPLMLQTADAYYRRRGGPAGTVIKLLQKLIERKVWTMDDDMVQVFVQSFRTMLPGTLALVKTVPHDALKRMVEMDAQLATAVRGYVSKMSDSARKPYRWLLH